MGRERLMEEQRARMEARRKKLKEAVEKAAKKQEKAKAKKSVTRDTSKDQSRKTVDRLTGGKQPKTGAAATAAAPAEFSQFDGCGKRFWMFRRFGLFGMFSDVLGFFGMLFGRF